MDFSSLIGTNYAATDNDIVQITAMISESTAQLTSFKKEMDQVQFKWNDLLEKSTILERQISDYRALTAPIRRLPEDILQEVFLQCLPQTHNAILSSSECPILLGRICRRWRDISLNTASLWASLHIPIPHVQMLPLRPTAIEVMQSNDQRRVAPKVAQRRARAITEWLGRSGACTLNISIYERHHGGPDPSPPDIRNIIFDALIPFADRWGSLHCDTPASSSTRIAALAPSVFSRLHTLKVQGPLGGYRLQVPLTESGFIRAPQLKIFSYMFVMEDPSKFRLRLSQLTTLELYNNSNVGPTQYLTVDKVAMFLTACPLLRECRFDVAKHRESNATQAAAQTPSNDIPVSIPLLYLRRLHIDSPWEDISTLFDALDLPVLEHLEYHTGTHTAVPLLSLLPRTANTLHVLTLDPRFYSLAELDTCFCACAGVTELTLRQSEHSSKRIRPPVLMQLPHQFQIQIQNNAIENVLPVDDDLLKLLGSADAGDVEEILLPKLRVFKCSIQSTFSDAAILALLNSRLDALKTVKIAFERQQEFSVSAEVINLATRGCINCQLTYAPATQYNQPFTYLASEGITSDE